MIYSTDKRSKEKEYKPSYQTPELKVNPIQGQGWDEKPINIKSQAYNKYLDGCIIEKGGIVTEAIINVTEADLSKTGRLSWSPKAFNDGLNSGIGLQIPELGTYLITGYVQLDTAADGQLFVNYTRGSTTYAIVNNGIVGGIGSGQTIPVVSTVNFNSGDIVRYETSLNGTNSVNVLISITKIS